MISVFGSDIGDQEIEAAVECLKSQWLGFGKKVDDFEKVFASHFNLNNCLMVDSGSNALYMAVRLLNLEPNDEIIVPSFTWVSCAQAILLSGQRPVFCDVDPNTMNVRREDIEPCISPRTKAVMVVHYAGLPVDMQPILDLGYPIIEDAAHAVSATHKGKSCGGIGDIGIYSFDAIKNLTAGEAGAVTAQKEEHIERARWLRYCGIGKSGFEAATGSTSRNNWWEYEIREAFIKMLPTNLAAAIAIVQLRRIVEMQERRQQIWAAYDEGLADIPEIRLPKKCSPGDTHGLFTYCIKTPKRDLLAQSLLDAEIYTTLRYHPLHMNPLYDQTAKCLPNSEQLNKDALSIPLHPRLSDDDVNYVIQAIRNFADRHF
jgi:aminotransferase|tara:strand:+ start:7005 stop:8123 length:1119 start_codon:yes stop_codon:yes gene_type:complete